VEKKQINKRWQKTCDTQINLTEGTCKQNVAVAVAVHCILRRKLKNMGGWFFYVVNVVGNDLENITELLMRYMYEK
jgi:hypothetical protein